MWLPWVGRRVVPLCRECGYLGKGGGLFPCVGSVVTLGREEGCSPVQGVWLPWVGRWVIPCVGSVFTLGREEGCSPV